MFGLVTRRRYDAELRSLRSQYEALRERCEGAERRVATERNARRTITHQFTEADEARTALAIVNTCLTEDLAAARERLAEVEAASCDTAATHWRAQAKREKKRADALQKAYDDSVGLKPRGIEDSSRWQPGYQVPEVNAS